MTTQDQPVNDTIRRLRRRTSDRVIGGVAGGLGDYLNVDPLLIRIGFVGLMVFGGAGLVLYVIAWLLIPAEGHDHSAVENLLRAILSRPGIWLVIVFAAIVLFVIIPMNSYGGYALDLPGALFWAIAVLVVGVLLLRRESPAPASAQAPTQTPTASAIAAEAVPVRPREAPKPRGPLGWYTLAAALIVVGVLAGIQNIASLDMDLGQYFGVALLILGVGLVIGAWWGNARLLILLGILLLPLGAFASFITAPIEGGFADLTVAPQTAQELQPEYRLIGGRMTLDLTQVPANAEPIQIDASVAMGQLTVIVPENASLDVQVAVGGGGVGFLGDWIGGAGVTNRYTRDGTGQEMLLALEAGIGEIRITSPDARGRCLDCDCGWFTSCAYPLVPGEEY